MMRAEVTREPEHELVVSLEMHVAVTLATLADPIFCRIVTRWSACAPAAGRQVA